ncbi:hypothetical protein [Bacillus cereus]
MLITFALPATKSFADSDLDANSVVPQTNVTEQNLEINQNEEEEVEAAGKLGFLVKGGIQLLEVGVRKGGPYLSKVVSRLDSKSGKYVNNNISKVADGLKYARNRIGDGEEIAQSTLKNIFKDTLGIAGVKSEYRVEIADVLAKLVMALL